MVEKRVPAVLHHPITLCAAPWKGTHTGIRHVSFQEVIFGRYPTEFKDLTAACLTWRSIDRPALLDMRRRIDEYLAANPAVANDRSLGPLQVKRETKFRIGDPLSRDSEL